MFAIGFMVVLLLVIVIAITAIAQPPTKWVKWFTDKDPDKK